MSLTDMTEKVMKVETFNSILTEDKTKYDQVL